MVLDPPVERLYFALTGMVVLEKRIKRTVADLRGDASVHPASRDLLAGIEDMASTHLGVLCERLQTPADDEGTHASTRGPRDPAEIDGFAKLHAVSSALGVAYSIVQEAIIRYSTIQPIALRAADSWATADEGTAGSCSPGTASRRAR